MSFILDALKKSEAERQDQAGGDPGGQKKGSRRSLLPLRSCRYYYSQRLLNVTP